MKFFAEKYSESFKGRSVVDNVFGLQLLEEKKGNTTYKPK